MRWGGGEGEGGVNSAVTKASDAAAFLEQGFVCVCSPMVEPSVYDELQCTIDLVTAPKELGVSPPLTPQLLLPASRGMLSLRRLLYWLCSTALKTKVMFWFWVVVANCNHVLGTQPLDCVPKQAASKKLRCDGFETQVLDYMWQACGARPQALGELGRLAKAARTKRRFRHRPRAAQCDRNYGTMLKVRLRRGTSQCFGSLKLQPCLCR